MSGVESGAMFSGNVACTLHTVIIKKLSRDYYGKNMHKMDYYDIVRKK